MLIAHYYLVLIWPGSIRNNMYQTVKLQLLKASLCETRLEEIIYQLPDTGVIHAMPLLSRQGVAYYK